MSTARHLLAITVVGAAIAGLAACGTSSSPNESNSCANEPIDTFKELLIVEDEVVTDARASNTTDGAWSFRHAVENMAPVGVDPGDFVYQWLNAWVSVPQLNGFPIDSSVRQASMNQLVLCPWMQASADNVCNSDCSTCTAHRLDLAKAPFRLIGIINRMDQRNLLPDSPNGEGRLVFAVTQGPGDDAASKPIAMVVNFEYALPEARTLTEWAQSWHALGKFDSYDEPYRAAVQAITDGFVTRGARPSGVNGNALSQIRTNESALNWIWQLREFSLQPNGLLDLRPAWNTPDQALNGTDTLQSYIAANVDLIKQQKNVLPDAMRTGAADALQFSWSFPGLDSATQQAFAQTTCNGCHSNQSVVDSAFHISPFRVGRDRISAFLVSPTGGTDDETHNRASGLREALGATCGH